MKKSAGILVYRFVNEELQFFLVHPGGPFWKNKNQGAWSIPKGEYNDGEDPLETAKREFHEETGQHIEGKFIPLTSIKQKGGKMVHCWAVEGSVDADNIISNQFELEWPPGTGKKILVPEVDKGAWFTKVTAAEMINSAQVFFLEEVERRVIR